MATKNKSRPVPIKKTGPPPPAKKKGSPSSKKKPVKDPKVVADQKAAKLANKLLRIKYGLEGGTITTFDDIFSTLSPTLLRSLIDVNFYGFDKKIADPGKFTYNDMIRLANLLKVNFDIVNNFIVRLLKNPARGTENEHRILYHTTKP